VRRTLVAHRFGPKAPKAAGQSVAPWNVEALANDANRFAHAGQWLWATAALANLGELITRAEDGEIKASQAIATDPELRLPLKRLATVRNACFHPAFCRESGSQRPHLRSLVDELKQDDDPGVRRLAPRIEDDWSYFADRTVTAYALRLLDDVGVRYARTLRHRGDAFVAGNAEESLRDVDQAWRSRARRTR
jgi:hypothetical protein